MDYQKSSAYRWEDENVPRNARTPLSMTGCRTLIRQVCREYGVDIAQLIDGGNDKASWSNGLKGIKLAGEGKCVAIVLHEVAHWILQRRGECDGHGPRWVRLYIDLLVRYDQWDNAEMSISAAVRWKLDVGKRGTGPQPECDLTGMLGGTTAAKREQAARMLAECDAEDAWFAEFSDRRSVPISDRKAARE